MRWWLDAACLALAVLVAIPGIVFSQEHPIEAPAVPPLEGDLRSYSVEATGRFEVECASARALMDPSSPGLRFVAGAARLRVYETTLIRVEGRDHDDPLVEHRDAVREATVLEIPAGTVVRTTAQGMVYVGHAPDLPTQDAPATGPLLLEQEATAFNWSAQTVPPGRQHRSLPFIENRVHAQWLPEVAIRVKSQAQSRLQGSGVAYVDEATFEGPGFRHEMPPRFQAIQDGSVGPVTVAQRVLETFAVLEFQRATFELDAQAAHVYCGELRFAGAGNVTFPRARGMLTRPGDETARFANETAIVAGTIRSESRAAILYDRPESQMGDEGRPSGYESSSRLHVTTADVRPPAPMDGPWFWGAGLAIAVAWAVARLGPLGLGFLYTRVSLPRALANPVRALVHDVVRGRPAITVWELSNEAGLRPSAVRYHVRVLVRLRLLKQMRYARDVHLYPSDASLTMARQALVWERDGSARWIVEWMRSSGGSPREAMHALRNAVGLSRVGAWKALRRAKQCGLLRATPVA